VVFQIIAPETAIILVPLFPELETVCHVFGGEADLACQIGSRMCNHADVSATRRCILLTIVIWATAGGALAHPFASVVSFGDSLSDTTNNPAKGDYWEGRWSNGPLWDEYLAGNLGAILYDYAFSGSQTSDLSKQVAAADAGTWDDTNTLFTVWSGANDFIDNAAANGYNYADWEATVYGAVENIAQAVSTLSASGARYILVLNMPDLSQLPALETNAEFASERSTIVELVSEFNSQLDSALAGVVDQNPNLRLSFVDDFTLLDNIIANPSAHGFTVVTNDALNAFVDPSFDGPGADYLFWDVIHPTTKAHGLLAQLAGSVITQFPPSFVAEPGNQTVAVGDRVTFSVSALDATAYQWLFAGHKIIGATNDTYVLSNATAAAAGVYAVEAMSPFGTATSANARLIVDVAPRIAVQPRSGNGIAGKTVVLSARATGSSPLSYQWQFHDSDIASATNATLVLTHLQTNAAGSYAVVAYNAVGSATSRVAVLNVIVPPQITSQPASVDAVDGAAVTFSVVAQGTAPFHYQWLRDGVGMAHQTNSSFTISAVKPAQAGRFRVLVRNKGGSVLSSAAVLQVEKSPGVMVTKN
jgi:phospholipase/lecithinase/hemolysin